MAEINGHATGRVVLRWGDRWERFVLRVRVVGNRLVLKDGRVLAVRMRD